jgi:large subunit ribosomal protein L13
MSTRFPSGQEIARKWYVVDATGQTLGRLASRVASILAGKESPIYTPFLDTGDHVIVVNAGKIRVTGMKAEQKLYHRYTGFPGGLRTDDFRKRFDRKPELVVQEAILGMLPKSKLGRAMGKKLKVYKGDKHDHQAQQPKPLALVERKGA